MTTNRNDIDSERSVKHEAAAWIAQLNGGDPSKKDLLALEEWMSRSPRHQAEIKNYAKLWGQLNLLTILSEKSPVDVPAKRSVKVGSGQYGWAMPVPALVAFLFVCVIALGGGLYSAGFLNPNAGYTTQQIAYSTEIGSQKSVELPDGSSIRMNTDTRLTVQYSSVARIVNLERGEAYFQVAKNKDRPFQVLVGARQVHAVGTAFSVRLIDSSVEVTVSEGRIRMSSLLTEENLLPEADFTSSTPVVLGELSAGKKAVFDREIEAVEDMSQSELENELSWRDGIVVFSGEPLSEAVQEISRYALLNIEIPDPEVRLIRIGGRFRIGQPEAMFDVFESTFGLRVIRISPSHVVISKAD